MGYENENMKTKIQKRPDPNQMVFHEFGLIFSSNRGIFLFFAICLPTIFLFGFFVAFILTGLFMGFILLARVFDLPYRLLRRLIRSVNSPSALTGISLWNKVFTIISMVIPAWMIYMGIKGLLTFEFCVSLVCTLSESLAR
jgi:hypothetical protein